MNKIAEYSKTEAALSVLSEKYGGVLFDLSTSLGMSDAKKARAEIRGFRTSLEDVRKEIKAPALERCRLIDDEAKRITAALLKLETPIDVTIKEWEAKKEAERKAKEETERIRVADIKAKILAIERIPIAASLRSSSFVGNEIDKLRNIEIDSSFSEFYGEAVSAKNTALESLDMMLKNKIEAEAEADRLKTEREEFARLQAEEAKKLAEERSKREEEERAARGRIEAAEREARERVEAAERESRKRIDEENERVRLAQKVEAEKIEKERADAAKKQAEVDAQNRIKREAEEAEERKLERERYRKSGAVQILADFVSDYGDMPEFEDISSKIQDFLFILNRKLG